MRANSRKGPTGKGSRTKEVVAAGKAAKTMGSLFGKEEPIVPGKRKAERDAPKLKTHTGFLKGIKAEVGPPKPEYKTYMGKKKAIKKSMEEKP